MDKNINETQEQCTIHSVMRRDEFARQNWELILKQKVALTQQRVIDSNQYSANCYAPIQIDDVIDSLYADYLRIHGA